MNLCDEFPIRQQIRVIREICGFISEVHRLGRFAEQLPSCKADLHFHGTVVAAHDAGVYPGTDELGGETLGAEPVVDAPAGILLAGMEAITPP